MEANVRKVQANEADQVNELFVQVRFELAMRGLDLWQHGYPTSTQIAQDIANSTLFGWWENGLLRAVVTLDYNAAPQYMDIQWPVREHAAQGSPMHGSPLPENSQRGNPASAPPQSRPLTLKRHLVVHRLAVRPTAQGKGYGSRMMDFVERYASEQKARTIRLDTYIPNARNMGFYAKRGYIEAEGHVFFAPQKGGFACFEKAVD